MNDYTFGNQIYSLRKSANLSQTDLANLIGVTNKAVSKWENGRAKPTTNALNRLSNIFNVSVEELLNAKERKDMKKVEKIVITGGPCAGKSTAMTWLMNYFTKQSYRVLFVPETATELITGGVAPWTCKSNLDYQFFQIKLQIEKEKIFEAAAQNMNDEKVLIVCDRGLMDNFAYVSDAEAQAIFNKYGSSIVDFRDSYDAIFHLVTAAKGAEEFYTTANNSARTESVEEARQLDDKLIKAWTGHQHLRVIDNSTDFDEKMQRLISEVASFLGEPEPFEIERKFLIEYPEIAVLEKMPNCRKVSIIQTYLRSDSDDEIRVRQRGENGHYVYYKTTKRNVSSIKRIETEKRLSREEYLAALIDADYTRKTIVKTRYCLVFDNHYYEIDVYPFWDDKAIMEIELLDENEEFKIPDMLKVIKEVTNDPKYKNSYLAANI